MAKGDLHISRRFVHSDLNLTESDVKVITNNRIESPFRSTRDSHSVSSFTPDKGMSGRSQNVGMSMRAERFQAVRGNRCGKARQCGGEGPTWNEAVTT